MDESKYNMQDFEINTRVLRHFSPETASRILRKASLFGSRLSEIRVYKNSSVVLVCAGKNIPTSILIDESEFNGIVASLCDNSLYAHSDTMRDGFIYTKDGLRAGVCGRAVLENGKISVLSEITSLCIRIPNRYPGTADDLLPYILGDGCLNGMLICSPPGIGKTTVLRELAVCLSETTLALRVGIVDTRFEIGYGLSGRSMDIFSGYPRAIGIDIALRTMAPQILICDEIYGAEDSEAVFRCKNAGVAMIASAHAGSLKEVTEKAELNPLFESGVFHTVVFLFRESGTVRHEIRVLENKG